MIKTAYKKTKLPAKEKTKKTSSKGVAISNKKKKHNEEDFSDDSMDMSDLEKIQKQISTLQKKI